LLADSSRQVVASACSTVKCRIEYRQSSRAPQRARQFDGRPRWRRRQPPAYAFQRRAHPLVHLQLRVRSHPYTGIENMDAVIGLGIESVQNCGGVHACDDRFARDQIERRQSL
jgi:hypothetical protein